MKKKVKIILFSVLAVAAVFVFKETKRKQKEVCGRGKHVPYGPYEAVIKRPLDIMIVAMAFVPLLPVMGIIALLVRFKLGSPVLFKQERPGLDEKIFTLYKFRTMTDEKDKDGQLLPDEKRLTKFGKWLRSTSLDELPQLFNILKGEMSIIGPRPLMPEYLVVYTERERKRHLVRPGLVGLAGVNGRNNQSWDSKFRYDLEYVENVSFKMDCYIFFRCISTVLGQKDIYCEPEKLEEDSFMERIRERGL